MSFKPFLRKKQSGTILSRLMQTYNPLQIKFVKFDLIRQD
jgi:hypothetical protein